jgi:hypothetical protein
MAKKRSDQLRATVDRSRRWKTTWDADMQKRVKSPQRYPICSEITHANAAKSADDTAEPARAEAVATITKPSIEAGNNT